MRPTGAQMGQDECYQVSRRSDAAGPRTIALSAPIVEGIVVRLGECAGPLMVHFEGRTLEIPPGESATFEARALPPIDGGEPEFYWHHKS